ncbi:hypothetical protein M9Y10_045690 [Tritrichomonas musculus]|uniref:Phosphatidylinositol 3,4,5-trisphosphate 3-phosphatase and dual-specificity protein phosphatase PTEN n=1 Tax=Tritrichomonas musculus TaxID=1915356 RepID=A0ABR2JVY7_9EUKA
MLNKIRGAVSKKKKRLQDGEYDLDMAYIGDRIIAMGYPSFGFESYYRNDYKDVRKFLDERHKDKYFVYNLCSERDYDKACFDNRVEKFPFDDHNPPEFDMIRRFCNHAQSWLDADPENIVVVHCKAGKGRTGCMICALMLQIGMFETTQESLQFYGETRTYNAKGVTIPSQRRYVYYYEVYLQSHPQLDQPFISKPCFVTKLHFAIVPQKYFSSDLRVQIMKMDEEVVYEGFGTVAKSPKMHKTNRTMTYYLDDLPEIVGDFRIAAIKSKKVCWFMWFNSSFIRDGEDSFGKVDVDKANKSKNFEDDFRMCVFAHH